MYFANWMGHSMVLPDPDAAAIYQTTNVDVTADPVDPANDTGTGVSGPAQNQLNAVYARARSIRSFAMGITTSSAFGCRI